MVSSPSESIIELSSDELADSELNHETQVFGRSEDDNADHNSATDLGSTSDAVNTRRTSGRISKQPIWLKDYVHKSKSLYPMSNHLSYENTSAKTKVISQNFLPLWSHKHLKKQLRILDGLKP